MADVNITALSSSAIISSHQMQITNHVKIFCLSFLIYCSKSSKTV